MSTMTPDPAIEATRMREVLAHYPTGVVVITAPGDPAPAGLAVGSFTSVSLDPPLVGFFVGKGSSTWPLIEAAGRFCANILGDHQEEVCRVFAAKGADRFAAISWRSGSSGSPIIDDAVAWVDCRIWATYEAGDHTIYIGRVIAGDAREGAPLLYYRGGYGRFTP